MELSEFESAVAEIDSMETLPVIAHRLMQATADPNCSLGELGEILSSDAALAARVMQLANSAMYGRRKVEDLSAAVMRLGMREIRSLAVAAALTQNKHPHRFDEAMWEFSLRCATLSESIARTHDTDAAGNAFLCGLLHDFGTSVMARIYGDEYRTLIAHPGRREQREKERDSYGFDHCDIGCVVASQWNLDQEFEYVMLLHETPMTALTLCLPEKTANAVVIVGLASRIAARQADDSDAFEATDDELELAALVGVEKFALIECVARASARFEDLCQVLMG